MGIGCTPGHNRSTCPRSASSLACGASLASRPCGDPRHLHAHVLAIAAAQRERPELSVKMAARAARVGFTAEQIREFVHKYEVQPHGGKKTGVISRRDHVAGPREYHPSRGAAGNATEHLHRQPEANHAHESSTRHARPARERSEEVPKPGVAGGEGATPRCWANGAFSRAAERHQLDERSTQSHCV